MGFIRSFWGEIEEEFRVELKCRVKISFFFFSLDLWICLNDLKWGFFTGTGSSENLFLVLILWLNSSAQFLVFNNLDGGGLNEDLLVAVWTEGEQTGGAGESVAEFVCRLRIRVPRAGLVEVPVGEGTGNEVLFKEGQEEVAE